MRNVNILIIDDNVNNLYSLECILKQLDDVDITQASLATDALKLLEKQEVDLILVDIQMPEMNGFEFFNEIKKVEKLKDIPVIFVTAYFKSEEFESRGYKLGAFDYITKPIDEFRLLNKVILYQKLFNQQEQLKLANIELSQSNRDLKDALQKVKHLDGN